MVLYRLSIVDNSLASPTLTLFYERGKESLWQLSSINNFFVHIKSVAAANILCDLNSARGILMRYYFLIVRALLL